MKEVSTCPSLSTLEIKNTQLKEEPTATRIKNDSLRDENVSIKARFQELYKSKVGSNSSGATIPVKPKAVASGLYVMTLKYVLPQKRINRETSSSLPRKETVTVVNLSNVLVNLPTGIKYVPARSKKVKRVAKPPRNLNKKNRVDSSLNDKRTGFISKFVSVCKNECLVFGNHDECVVKSVNEKYPSCVDEDDNMMALSRRLVPSLLPYRLELIRSRLSFCVLISFAIYTQVVNNALSWTIIRRLEDKQPEEKTNTDCMVYTTMYEEWGRQTYGCCRDTTAEWAEDTTMSTYLVNRSPSSAIGFKTPVDMLGFFGWLANIMQGMLEPVKVKCIFIRYHKTIAGNKLWRLDGVTSKVVLYRNMDFNESGKYKKTFIGSVVVATMDKIYIHELLAINNTVACEVIFKWDAGFKDDMDARSDVYVLSNSYKKYNDDSDGYYWEYMPVKAKGNILDLEIIKDQSGNTLSVSQSRIHNANKRSYIYAVGSQEYQTVYTRPDIASAGVDMLYGFDRGLQTNVQVFVDFDYAMGRSITVMSRSITGYRLMILGCARSLKANLQHMEALSTTGARYVTFTEAWKKEIWLKGLLTESRCELRLVAGIATSALIKGCFRSEVPAHVKVVAYWY
nr:zinc finger, CCHC-type [Tanacetum cinerariifolium]